MRPPRALPAAHFDRNERYAYFGDRTIRQAKAGFGRSAALGKRKKEGLALKARHKDNQLAKTLDPWLEVENIMRLEARFQR